jgi:hypothetical protein
MSLCCINCFADEFVRDFVQDEGIVGNCEYCGSEDVAVADSTKVGDFIREGLARAYENVDRSGLYWDAGSREYIAGESATEVLNNEEVFSELVYSRFRDAALAGDLLTHSGPDYYDVMDGADDWLDGGMALIVLRGEFAGAEGSHYQSSWDSFKASVKHHARFFDFPDDDSREALLGPIVDFFPKIKRRLRAGAALYRSRLANGSFPADAWLMQKELGPPPVTIAKHSRMSPPGISYAYLSKEPDTCVAEIKPNVGSEVWLAKFITKKSLRILDLTMMPKVHVPSIFDSDYDHQLRWARDFFEHFQTEISRPTASDDNLLDYVPTQVLAEFIHSQGYDGLKFKSSQKPSGVNYTLFCGPDYDFEAGYWPRRPRFHEWLRLEKLTMLHMKSMKLNVEEWHAFEIAPEQLNNPDDEPTDF